MRQTSSYEVPAQETRVKIVVKNSKFIATGARVSSVDEAKAFVRRIKQEFPNVSHNVPVYIIGHGDSTTVYCSDDGEPSGTAGRPALAVLRGSDLGDIAVVISRIFGGTKLGTGGLVKAYRDAAKALLEKMPRELKVNYIHLRLFFSYSIFDQVRLLIDECGGTILEQEFSAEITLDVQVNEEKVVPFRDELMERWYASMKVEEL